MKKFVVLSVIAFGLSGCANYPMGTMDTGSEPQTATPALTSDVEQACLGTTDLPVNMVGQFDAANDPELLNSTIGSPNKGMLCQGKVYESKANAQVTLYRAWNSTNPGSKLGKWWAFNQPAGEVAQYRSDFEICYQWSPLDKLVRCELKPGTKVVVGNGQSAECSAYLTYPVSAAQQIYIEDAANSVINCQTFTGEFSWK